jgi:hypothetical protein
VLGFLRAGGAFRPDQVEYRGVKLPRSLFAGSALGGVGYLKNVIDYGGTISAGYGSFITSLPNGLRFESDSRGFIDSLCMLDERFVSDEYSWLEVQGRIVIDIGSNIGDSALYFVKRGATYVYGYEPDETVYAAALRNLRLNGVTNVEVIKAAVRGEAQAASVGTCTLNDVVARITAEHPGAGIVCKIDCEGCEYEIMGSTNVRGALAAVSQVMIEYHWRSPEPLMTALRSSGFEVETSTETKGVGWVRARRADSE